MHKAGFVNIIGLPNVGKSTVMNALLKENLSIVTHKAQTTRNRILGILNTKDYQIVFSDTPGFIKDSSYKLHESMLNVVKNSFEDVDVILLMIAANQKDKVSIAFINLIKNSKAPVVILINKIDLINQKILDKIYTHWEKKLPKAKIFPISAIYEFRPNVIIKLITSLLPEASPYFEKDALTDKSERFFVEEIIRKAILNSYKQEIPYSCLIEVTNYKETETLVSIDAYIFVSRDSQKKILIGYQGKNIKKTATIARKEIEVFLKKKVFLKTFVKVKENWQNNERELKRFGFN